MAKAIRMIERKTPTETERQAESIGGILKSLADNGPAVVQFLDVLGELHKSGAMDIVHGALKNRDELGKVGFEFVKVANLPVLLKNMISLVQMLSRLDPAKSHKMIEGLGQGIQRAIKEDDEPPKSLLGLARMMSDPDVRTAMATGLHFLQGMGAGINSKDGAHA